MSSKLLLPWLIEPFNRIDSGQLKESCLDVDRG
jgi:hypothetical protein